MYSTSPVFKTTASWAVFEVPPTCCLTTSPLSVRSRFPINGVYVYELAILLACDNGDWIAETAMALRNPRARRGDVHPDPRAGIAAERFAKRSCANACGEAADAEPLARQASL